MLPSHQAQPTQAVLLPPTAVKANHSSRVVSMDGTAAVPCHIAGFDAFPKEIRVSVLRGLRAPQKICTAILNLTESHEKTVTKAEGGNVSRLFKRFHVLFLWLQSSSAALRSLAVTCRTMLKLSLNSMKALTRAGMGEPEAKIFKLLNIKTVRLIFIHSFNSCISSSLSSDFRFSVIERNILGI